MAESAQPLPRRSSLLGNLVLALVTIVLFFGTAELLARRRFPPPVNNGLYEPDPEKVFRHKANVPGMTNSFGHRDTEIPLQKPEGAVRVVALGDSITYGVSIPSEANYPQVLERRLARALPGRQVDVINTAMSGNTAFQELVDLERALPLEPDVLVLQFTLNDVTEPYQVLRRFGGTGEDYHGVQVNYLHYRLSQRSAFYRAMRALFARLRFGAATREEVADKAKEREIYNNGELVEHPDDPRLQEAWREYLVALQQIVDLAKSRELPLVILASPFSFQLGQPPSKAHPQARLRDFARERGLPFVDLLPSLQDDLLASLRSDGNVGGKMPEEAIPFVKKRYPHRTQIFWKRYFIDHDHYSVEGHRYAAEQLLPELYLALRRKRPELAPQLDAASAAHERQRLEEERKRALQETKARAARAREAQRPGPSPKGPPSAPATPAPTGRP